MRRFNEFSAVWRAPLFSRALYQDVGTRWTGIGVRYLALWLAVTWLLVFMKYTISLSGYISTEGSVIARDFPAITIKGGKASSPATQPYVWKDSSGSPLMVLDTTGATRKPSEKGAMFLVTEQELLTESNGHVEAKPLSSLPDMTVTGELLLQWMRGLRNSLLVVLFPLSWAVSLVYRVIGTVVLGAIGLGIAAALHVRVPFAGLMRLAAVSMTTGMLLGTVLWLVPVAPGCVGWLIGVLLGTGYFVYGVKVTADMAEPVVAEGAPIEWEKGAGEGESMFP